MGNIIKQGIKYQFISNDDYLFAAGLLQDVRDIHKKIYYNAYTSEWVRGNSEIPYIHLDFVERPALKKMNLATMFRMIKN